MQEPRPRESRVGERLRAFRRRCGLSQRAFAALVNVTHSTISKWEKGKAPIDADHLPRFAAALQVDACDFFRDVDPALAPGPSGGARENGARFSEPDHLPAYDEYEWRLFMSFREWQRQHPDLAG